MNAERLRELRVARIMTQKELAKEAKVGLRTLSALEGGGSTAHPSTIRKLAAALGVEPRELIGGQP